MNENMHESFSLFLDMLIERDKYDPHIWNQTEIVEKIYGVKSHEVEKIFDHILFNELLQEQSDELAEQYNIDTKMHKIVNEGNYVVKNQIYMIINNINIQKKLSIVLKDDIIYYDRLVKHFGVYDKIVERTNNFNIYKKLLNMIYTRADL